jgi:hypothetical protein
VKRVRPKARRPTSSHRSLFGYSSFLACHRGELNPEQSFEGGFVGKTSKFTVGYSDAKTPPFGLSEPADLQKISVINTESLLCSFLTVLKGAIRYFDGDRLGDFQRLVGALG